MWFACERESEGVCGSVFVRENEREREKKERRKEREREARKDCVCVCMSMSVSVWVSVSASLYISVSLSVSVYEYISVSVSVFVCPCVPLCSVCLCSLIRACAHAYTTLQSTDHNTHLIMNRLLSRPHLAPSKAPRLFKLHTPANLLVSRQTFPAPRKPPQKRLMQFSTALSVPNGVPNAGTINDKPPRFFLCVAESERSLSKPL